MKFKRNGLTVKPGSDHVAALIERSFLILVLNSDEGAGIYELFGDVCEAPETGVVQRRVAVLVDKVHIRFVS